MATGTTRMVLAVKEMLQLSSSTLPFSSLRLRGVSPPLHFSLQLRRSLRPAIRCASSDSDGANRVSARLSQVHQLLQQAEHRALSADQTPPPKITLDHVTVSFARSGGPGGQNVNKVNTKVDMRFNVKNAPWLTDRVRDKILQTEKNRINKDGELVISSTKTRTQKGNIEDALAKLQRIAYQYSDLVEHRTVPLLCFCICDASLLLCLGRLCNLHPKELATKEIENNWMKFLEQNLTNALCKQNAQHHLKSVFK